MTDFLGHLSRSRIAVGPQKSVGAFVLNELSQVPPVLSPLYNSSGHDSVFLKISRLFHLVYCN